LEVIVIVAAAGTVVSSDVVSFVFLNIVFFDVFSVVFLDVVARIECGDLSIEYLLILLYNGAK
jgi:hypothetical protein